MSFELRVKNYLKEFQYVCNTSNRSGSTSTEMATRPVVHKLIEDLFTEYKSPSQKIDIHHDVTYTRDDRPDWRVEDPDNFGIYCFGDHKNVSLSGPFKLKPHEELQIKRYLSYGRPVFVFDGIEFLIFEPNENRPRRLSLIKKPISLDCDWSLCPIDLSIQYEISELLKNTGFKKWTESQLINQLAVRARNLADELVYLLRAPKESGDNAAENELINSLHTLLDELATHHDESLRNEAACADFIAQVLTFGFFYAHTRILHRLESPQERKKAINNFWSQEQGSSLANDLRVFASLESDLSKHLNGKNPIGLWNEDITRVLAHAEYIGVEQGPKDFHALFEEFLSKFDSTTRFDRGAFYTPKVVTDWVVSGAEFTFKKYFGETKYKLIEKIIDPCCGTGGFLESIAENFQGLPPSTILAGFEVLPAPYALAYYRLAEVFQKIGKKFDLRILLTDTLSDKIFKKEAGGSGWASMELSAAKEICEPPLRLVIGNPPSSDKVASSSPRQIIDSLLNDFRPPKLEISSRQNTQKAINNEAYRFLRWSAERVLESGNGILALVLPGAFAYSVSFKNARKWFFSNFQDIYILELDADVRSSSSQSIFPVLQGRLVMFAIKRSAETASAEKCKLYHQDISFKKKFEKEKFLENGFLFESFDQIEIDIDNFKFTPIAKYPKELWDICWSISSTPDLIGIFKSHCSGIKPAPTSLVFHTQKNILLRRSSDIGQAKSGAVLDGLIKKWFSGQKKPPKNDKFSDRVKAELYKATKSPTEINRYIYRPFVVGWATVSPDLMAELGKTPGGGTRFRPEIKTAFDAGAAGIAFAPAPRDIGEEITRFTTFTWALPDNDLAARGSARVYCDIYPEKAGGSKATTNTNFSPEFSKIFEADGFTTKDMLFYIYAITSCSSYIDKFEGVLYEMSTSSPPRVPVLSDSELRSRIVGLGKKIAECENFDLKVMPNSSHTLQWSNELQEFELSKSKYSNVNQNLLLSGEDGSLLIGGVPIEVNELRVSGYNVLDSWIRSRKYAYLNRKFNINDAQELIDLITRISNQTILLSEVNLILEKAFENNGFISPPIIAK
jgi:hypothetical protein